MPSAILKEVESYEYLYIPVCSESEFGDDISVFFYPAYMT